MAQGVDIGTAWVTIAAEMSGITKDIEKGLGEAGEAGGREFEKGFERSTGKSGGALGVLERNSTKMLAAATAVGAGFYGLASAAGSLNAALQTSDRVFGDAADSVQAFAADTSDAVFLSEQAALQAANGFGIFATQAGFGAEEASAFSIQMVQLAADLAAVADVPVDQAVTDLKAAFAGSSETMLKYGINLNETELKAAYFANTGERITGVMTAQQRTMAMHWAVVEKGSFAYGAAQDEAGQFASQVDNLKATVGNIAADFGAPVVGFAAGLLSVLSGGLESVSAFNEATGGFAATGLAVASGIGAIGLAAGGIIGKVSQAANAFRGMSTAMQWSTGILGALGIAAVAGFTAYGLLTQRSREVAARTKEVAAALDEATDDAWSYALAAAGATGEIDGFAVAQRALSIALTTSGEDGEALVQSLGKIGQQSDDAFSILMEVATNGAAALTRLGQEAGYGADQSELLAQAALRIGEDWPLAGARAQVVIGELADEFGWTATQVTDFLAANGNFRSGLEGVIDAASAQDLEGLADQFLNSAVASSESAEALIEEARARAASNDIADSSVDVYFELQGILSEMAPAERQAALEALGLADGMDAAGDAAGGFETVAGDTIDVLSDADEAFNAAADAASAFDDALRRLTDPTFNLTEATYEQAIARHELNKLIMEAVDAESDHTNSLDVTTAAGKRNYDAIVDQRNAILERLDAEKRHGATSEQLIGLYGMLYSELVDQVGAFDTAGLSAEDYIATLGLTPDTVLTAVGIVGTEQAQAAIATALEALDKIPQERATRIDAQLNVGSVYTVRDQIQRMLDAQAFGVNVVYRSQTGGVVRTALGSNRAAAYGDFVPGNSWRNYLVGEAPWDEAIVPIGNSAAMDAQLASDARIREPIMRWAAEHIDPAVLAVPSGGQQPLVGQMVVNEAKGESVSEQLRGIMFESQYARSGRG